MVLWSICMSCALPLCVAVFTSSFCWFIRVRKGSVLLFSLKTFRTFHSFSDTFDSPVRLQYTLKINMTGWKIHHEWRSISYWKWWFSNIMLEFQGCTFFWRSRGRDWILGNWFLQGQETPMLRRFGWLWIDISKHRSPIERCWLAKTSETNNFEDF